MTDTASAAPSDLDIDATWDALPGIRIHNDANARGLDTQTMLRRAFARAVLAKWGRPAVVKWEPQNPPPQGVPVRENRAVVYASYGAVGVAGQASISVLTSFACPSAIAASSEYRRVHCSNTTVAAAAY